MGKHSGSVITSAETRLIRIFNATPAGDAIQEFSALELPMVWVSAADGLRGVGFGYTIGRGGAAIVDLLQRELLPQLRGHDAGHIHALTACLEHSIHALTPGCVASNALAAVNIALWDLAAKRAQAPLHRLLGGARDRVPVYNTDAGWLSRPLDELLDLCDRAVRRDGFRGVKLKVGKPDAEEDRDRIARVRDKIGQQAVLMADANQSWTPGEAPARMSRLEEFDLHWMEEPLPATDVQGHAQLRPRTRIPLAAGESLYSPAYFYEYVRAGALDILQPDVARLGGISNALEVCHLASAAGLPVATHVSPEISIAVGAAVTNCAFIEYLPQMEPVLRSRLHIAGGFAYAFTTPGHGIEFDEDALARFEATGEHAARDQEAAD